MSPQAKRTWEEVERWVMRGAGALALYFLIDTHATIKEMGRDLQATRTESALHGLRLSVHDSQINHINRKLNID